MKIRLVVLALLHLSDLTKPVARICNVKERHGCSRKTTDEENKINKGMKGSVKGHEGKLIN
jgi:hypothetical protein